jgi:hypothetical protein
MPNRNADNEREKYDHSGHPTQSRQESDLKAPGSPPRSVPDPGAKTGAKPRANQQATRPR